MKAWIRALPLFTKIASCALLFAVMAHVGSILSVPVADFFNGTVAVGVRALLSYLTSWLPFSLAELLLLSLPVWAFFLLRALYRGCQTPVRAFRCISVLCGAVAVLYFLFVFTLGVGYHGSTLDEKLGWEDKPPTKEELYETGLWLREEVNRLSVEITFDEKGHSVMPQSLSQVNGELLNAYRDVAEEYSFLPVLTSRVKPVLLSKPMTYTNITGVYTFLTGESNLNVNYPDFTQPFTAAHELAHQRGIARENEANFIAFLVCIRSDDLYIQYSAYMEMLIYVGNALAGADSALYRDLAQGYSEEVRRELSSYNAFWRQYQTVVSDVSGAINNGYLQLNGTQGTVSYGLVVDLAVSYYKEYRPR